jgi:hypothetical protein
MGYIDHNLISGEAVTYKAHLHWVIFLKPGLLSLVLAGLAALAIYYEYGWVGTGILTVSAIPLLVAAMQIGVSSRVTRWL